MHSNVSNDYYAPLTKFFQEHFPPSFVMFQCWTIWKLHLNNHSSLFLLMFYKFHNGFFSAKEEAWLFFLLLETILHFKVKSCICTKLHIYTNNTNIFHKNLMNLKQRSHSIYQFLKRYNFSFSTKPNLIFFHPVLLFLGNISCSKNISWKCRRTVCFNALLALCQGKSPWLGCEFCVYTQQHSRSKGICSVYPWFIKHIWCYCRNQAKSELLRILCAHGGTNKRDKQLFFSRYTHTE